MLKEIYQQRGRPEVEGDDASSTRILSPGCMRATQEFRRGSVWAATVVTTIITRIEILRGLISS
jgi:hypothetical protein